MVIVTQGTTNNVYYSTNYGATFTALTVGSVAMTSCAMSYDGSYLSVSNATTVYTLNLNTRGYAVTLGNQAGVTNQGLNAVAIGNQAGTSNQVANSVVLNSTGSVGDVYLPGFFVSPVATTASSNQSSATLLGYGADNQVTQTGMTATATGTLTVSSIIAPIDNIAQGIFLSSSATNAPAIQQYFQKTVTTINPTSGVMPFWANSMLYSSVSVTLTNAAGYVGGVLLSDGRVVFVPYNSTSIGIFNPSTNAYSTVTGAPGNYAYRGGVLLPDNRVIFVPYYATTVGIFNPTGAGSYTTATTTLSANSSAYTGGVFLADGRVLFVPCMATTIGIFTPSTNTYSTISPTSPTLAGNNAYVGGVLLLDGRVVFVPYNATTVGIFDPVTNLYSTVATNLAANSTAYIGGVLLPDGRVVFVPCNGAMIGIFNPTTNIYSTITPAVPALTGNASYVGGVLLPDGRVVFVPYNATTIGIFNPITNAYTTISGAPGSNAYWGGVLLPDGRIVFVPHGAATSAAVGIFTTTLSAPRELCLSPYCNKF
jgi:hypothetical protein